MAAAWRDYRLTRLLPHWSRDQILDAPAPWLDRLLKMDEIATELAEERAEKERARARGRGPS